MAKVYVAAFRHKTPGEGIGGVEWDFMPGEARKRVDAVVGPYACRDVEIEVPHEVFVAGKEAITSYVDSMIWEGWAR